MNEMKRGNDPAKVCNTLCSELAILRNVTCTSSREFSCCDRLYFQQSSGDLKEVDLVILVDRNIKVQTIDLRF